MPVTLEIIDDNIAMIVIGGTKGNSFSRDLLLELLEILEKVEKDNKILGIILTGEGRIFSVGGDVFAMYETIEQGGAYHYLDAVVPLLERLIMKILQLPKPIIAAINGAAAGAGLSVALACDERLAVAKAKFGMAFGGLGLTPDTGASILFAEYFGRAEAMEGIATARVYSSEEVAKRDIVQIVDGEELISTASEKLLNKTAVSAYSYGKTKLLLNQPLIRELEQNLPLELEQITAASKRGEFVKRVSETIEKLTK